ncbi:MAG TPA: adenylate/guanylate cyclase domain-containing protein [Rhodopila sp.]|nr:adenylate/guanylate cyclase domain-containing protein [Rhodopila sp.]
MTETAPPACPAAPTRRFPPRWQLGRSVGTALRVCFILVASTGSALLLTRPPFPLAAAEHLVDGVAFRFLGPQRQSDPNVIVVGIIEDTLAAFPYRSPIDRGFLAALIDSLAKAGVTAVGLDVVLDRPTEPAKDDALHRALTRTDIPVIAVSVAPDTAMSAAQRRFLVGFLEGVRTGDANLARDRFDDVVRTHQPLHPATGQPSFPAAVAAALGAPVPTEPFPIEWQHPKAGRTGIDVPAYPAQAVALLPPGWLKGKVALIGSLIPGTDEHRTVASWFGKPTFGVNIHAEVLSQLLERRAHPLTAVPWRDIAATFALAAAGLALGSAVIGLLGVWLIAAASLGFIAAALAVYAWAGVLLPIVAPTVALAAAGSGARAWRGLADRRDRQVLRTLFSRFVSGPVVDQIMQERDLFMAGGRPVPQELTATVLYADVASFTTICEGLPPAALIGWLDRYIDTMAGLISAHDGVLLRFIGDGILAVFGAPVPRRTEAEIDTDARNAARCALTMEQAMARLNDQFAAEGLPVGGLRIGLHTGPMVAGSLGTGNRIEFCLLGDTANTGARLEQLGKDYAEPGPRYCTIVVGGPTWERLGGSFAGIHVADVVLRGRHTALAAYRIDSAAARKAVSALSS